MPGCCYCRGRGEDSIFPTAHLVSRTRRLAVPAGVTVILVGFFIVALIGGGPGSDEAPPFNGQILRKNFEPTGIATVITVRALACRQTRDTVSNSPIGKQAMPYWMR
jgi:hypothetical protein